MATPTVSLAQLSRIAGDGTLAVDPQSGRPAKTPVIKCCQCESVASSQSQLPIKAMGKLSIGNIRTLATFNKATFGNLPPPGM